MPKEMYNYEYIHLYGSKLHIIARFSGNSNMFHNIIYYKPIEKCMVEPGAFRSKGRWGGRSNPPLVIHDNSVANLAALGCVRFCFF